MPQGALKAIEGLCRMGLEETFSMSEAWGPPQFQEKRSRSEKAILRALGAFRGVLGATLGIRNSILGIRNSILGMASHDLSNMKTTILGATPGAIPEIDGNPHEGFSFALGAFFENWGWRKHFLFFLSVPPVSLVREQRTASCQQHGDFHSARTKRLHVMIQSPFWGRRKPL